jgi:hypothetical protein
MMLVILRKLFNCIANSKVLMMAFLLMKILMISFSLFPLHLALIRSSMITLKLGFIAMHLLNLVHHRNRQEGNSSQKNSKV